MHLHFTRFPYPLSFYSNMCHRDSIPPFLRKLMIKALSLNPCKYLSLFSLLVCSSTRKRFQICLQFDCYHGNDLINWYILLALPEIWNNTGYVWYDFSRGSCVTFWFEQSPCIGIINIFDSAPSGPIPLRFQCLWCRSSLLTVCFDRGDGEFAWSPWASQVGRLNLPAIFRDR